VPEVRALHLVGIDDTDTVELTHLPPDLQYACGGNVEVDALVDPARVELVPLVCGGMSSDTVRTPRVDVVLNAICDADASTRALARAGRIVEQLGRPVVNDPARVAATRRDEVAAALAGIDGLVVPRTVRLAPRRARDVLVEAAATGVEPPFLVREAGAHGGQGLVLVSGPADAGALDRFAFDGRELYATEFVDFRSADGWYRKHRVLLVDGVVHRRHRLAGDHWNLHNRVRAEMERRPDEVAAEAAWVHGDPPLDPAPFTAVHARLGLDIVGIDFAALATGELLLFEANACMRVSADPGPSRAHLDTARLGIRRSVTELLVRRAGAE
jgi:glutathione synthase/RimK-type ligase-like ATP-grasp enzyme